MNRHTLHTESSEENFSTFVEIYPKSWIQPFLWELFHSKLDESKKDSKAPAMVWMFWSPKKKESSHRTPSESSTNNWMQNHQLGGGFLGHFHSEPWNRWSNLTCAYCSDGLVQPPTNYLDARERKLVSMVRINGLFHLQIKISGIPCGEITNQHSSAQPLILTSVPGHPSKPASPKIGRQGEANVRTRTPSPDGLSSWRWEFLGLGRFNIGTAEN